MPEHFHLLITEPERGNPSTVMQVLKQCFARHLLTQWRKRQPRNQLGLRKEALDAGHVWQRRFYDFVVWSERKRVEKLRYMHHNPVKRGLVLEPEQWAWSSFRHYAYEERGPVLVNEQRRGVLRVRGEAGNSAAWDMFSPPFEKREGWGSPQFRSGPEEGWAGQPAQRKRPRRSGGS